VTALIAWPNFHRRDGGEVENQVAAPAENENTQLAPSEKSLIESADGRVATVVTRREKNLVQRKNKRTHLTPTGLLMEGDYTQNPDCECNGELTTLLGVV
jgi:hypothetical protein